MSALVERLIGLREQAFALGAQIDALIRAEREAVTVTEEPALPRTMGGRRHQPAASGADEEA